MKLSKGDVATLYEQRMGLDAAAGAPGTSAGPAAQGSSAAGTSAAQDAGSAAALTV